MKYTNPPRVDREYTSQRQPYPNLKDQLKIDYKTYKRDYEKSYGKERWAMLPCLNWTERKLHKELTIYTMNLDGIDNYLPDVDTLKEMIERLTEAGHYLSYTETTAYHDRPYLYESIVQLFHDSNFGE